MGKQKKVVIHTPNLRALRYVGDFTKKLFEVRADKTAILEPQECVIVDRIAAQTLGRGKLFEEIDIAEIFGNDEIPQERGQNQDSDEAQNELHKIESFIMENFSECAGTDVAFSDMVIGMLERSLPVEAGSDEDKLTLGMVNPDSGDNPPPKPDVTEEDLTQKESGEENQTPESKEEKTSEPETQKEVIPFKEDIDSLSEDDVKKWCDHFEIKKGNMRVDTLKSKLLPHLPSKES